jgi:hypothetical protein
MQQVKGHFRSGKWIPQYSREEKRDGSTPHGYLQGLFEDEMTRASEEAVAGCGCSCNACKDCKE